MENTVPQIGIRRIGRVAILDIQGTFSGPWALRERGRIGQALLSEGVQRIILNLQGTTSLDTLGAKSLFESFPAEHEIGIMCKSAGVLDVLKRSLGRRQFRMLRDEAELTSVCGKELVEWGGLKDHRKSERLETAFPLEFYYEDDGEVFRFRGIVTNLNEFGLFAEYIDLDACGELLKRLDPYDLKQLHLKLQLPNRRVVQAEGIVVHRRLDGEQLGIGINFSNIGEREHDEIRRLLNLKNIQKQNLSGMEKGR